MLDKIIDNPDLDKYLTTFNTGQIVFLEGDDSQDLYILVSGEVDILKGNTKIHELTETGSLFGEMSFLLGARRTASVKARSDVKTICIPKEEITDFLREFPTVARELTKALAERLDETSKILYGLKEVCDQLPDAVILTDREGKVLTWNSAAEKLYGREWNQIRHRSVEEIYEEPQVYKNFLAEVQSRYSVREKTLKIKHPQEGTRYISTSMNLLYDGHYNFQGVLSVGRDVTAVKNLEMRYRRARYWFIPSFLLLGLLGAAIFFGYPYFSKGYQTVDLEKRELRDRLARDYLLLKSLLADPFGDGNRSRTSQLMKDFFRIYETTAIPYIGLVLIDKDKKVFNAYSVKADTDVTEMVDSSYGGIEFQGSEGSLHRVLSLYRADKEHPMGHKGIEIAFEMTRDSELLGWLAFQMDVDLLEKTYRIDEEGLKKFQFKGP